MRLTTFHHNSKNTLQIFSTVCPPLPSSLSGTTTFAKNPGNRNSHVCNITHMPKLTAPTLNAYLMYTG
eukprot:CCRYP_017537-RC/>CCRYP_017537-RC protein AED:0.48 eAED:0.48 QI:0/0/0/1/0/0/2/0/67